MIFLKDIQLKYGDQVIFNGANLVLKKNDKVGLIGKNGAGKTTLFRLITGAEKPNTGAIDQPSGLSIGHLKQHLESDVELSVIDSALSVMAEGMEQEQELNKLNYQLMTREDYESEEYAKLLERIAEISENMSLFKPEETMAEAEKILKGLGFKQEELGRPLKEFSGGWQMRVELAKLLLVGHDVLLLDEPTNYLDIESIVWFESYLRKYTGAYIVISHDQEFLDNTTRKTLELINSKLWEYPGNYSKSQELRQETQERRMAAFNNQQKVIAEKERTIERFRAKASKASLARSMEKQLNKMEKIEVEDLSVRAMKIRFQEPPRSGDISLLVDRLYKSFGSKDVIEDFSFQIDRGEKVALVGQNGQGKSTLVKLILKQLDQNSGDITIGHNVNIGVFNQDQPERLDKSMTVQETLEDGCPPELRPRIRSILGAFLFSGEDVDKRVQVLSGGEKTRLAIASLLLQPYNMLILDEPTNHLDIPSKNILKEALANFKGTVLVVSHDRYFLKGMTDKTYELRDKKLYTYLGDIEYFLEKRGSDSFREIETKSTLENTKQQELKTNSSLSREEIKAHKRKIQYLERDIEKLEEKKAIFEEKMADAEFYNNPDAQHIIEQHKELQKKVNSLYEQWESLSESI